MCPLPWSLAYAINYVGLVQFSTHLKEEMDLPLVMLTQTISFDATFLKKIQVYLQAGLRLHVQHSSISSSRIKIICTLHVRNY